MMNAYLRLPVEIKERPDVRRIVNQATRTIYINRAADREAKIIILLPVPAEWTRQPEPQTPRQL